MTPEDRASQFTELSFDPSLGEIFLPWSVGASIHVVPRVEPGFARKIHPRPRPDDLGLHPRGDRVDARHAHAAAGFSARTSLYVVRRRAAAPGLGARVAGRRAEQRHRQPLRSNRSDRRLRRASASSRGQLRSLRLRRGVLAIGAPHPGTELARAWAGPPSGPGRARRANSPSGAASSRSAISMRPS